MAEKAKYIDVKELSIILDIMKNPDSEFATDDYIDGFSDGISAAIKELEAFPTADVAPVKHGHWKKSKGYERPTENGFVHDDRYVCDCCGWGCCCETKLDFSFCPNCGAKMGGEVE